MTLPVKSPQCMKKIQFLLYNGLFARRTCGTLPFHPFTALSRGLVIGLQEKSLQSLKSFSDSCSIKVYLLVGPVEHCFPYPFIALSGVLGMTLQEKSRLLGQEGPLKL